MKPILMFAAAVFGLAACVGPQTKGADVAALAGNWQVITLGGTALPDTASVTINFAAPAVSGSSGCNQYSGTFSQKGNDLAFGPAAMTRKACLPARMDIEAGFTRALAAVTRYDMAEDTLRFYIGDTLVMQARPQ
ncbi:META domain-containing protein [Pseudorhodobacter sp. W20_MBD10_FR17]|uniref:META domain-containing protein n=1 Tax=Pseudorhodobacter sp. W20_MBD10_FR17 TaxID=3240266 RepID=UPI003F9AA54C